MKKRYFLGSPMLILLVLMAWDRLGTRVLTVTWEQPIGLNYPFLVSPFQVRKLKVILIGHLSPIRVFDVDNIFELRVTDGGYIYAKRIDLLDGRDDYEAYANRCEVHWTQDAITFTEPSGVTIRFPIEVIEHRI